MCSPEDFQRSKNCDHEITMDIPHFSQGERDGPSKPQDEVLTHGKVIQVLKRR